MILDDLYNPSHVVRWKKTGDKLVRLKSQDIDLRTKKAFAPKEKEDQQ